MLNRHYGRWIEQGADPATRAALAASSPTRLPRRGKSSRFPYDTNGGSIPPASTTSRVV
jgi:hypothetical protein